MNRFLKKIPLAALCAAMAAACLQRAALPGFAPGLAGAAFCILCCACAGSLEHTAVLALVLAMALTAAAPALCFAALAVAAGGLGTAVFCPGERRRICCRVCAGGAGRPQPDRRTHPRSCRRGRAAGLSALPGAGSAGGVSAACPTGRHPKPDQRGTQTFRRGRYLIRHCRNSERCMQLPDAAPRRKL